jgi:phosphoserine phosphatase RsbU/P
MFQDVRAREIPSTVRQDLRTLYDFYLDEDRRAALARIHPMRRAFAVPYWILRSLLLKLTPLRRLFLAIAFVFAFLGGMRWHVGDFDLSFDATPWAFLIVLFILMLELKDKLLAHDEIAVARQVQLALLPSADPQPTGFALWSHTRPANDVGGDLIDYIDDPARGTLGVALGDVAGKGLGAALLMAKLQASLRATASDSPSLAALAVRLNGILCRDGLDNRFATLFYVVIPSGGPGAPLRCLNAGHNPPLLARRGGVEQVPPDGRPLGMFPDSTYAEQSLTLEPDDLLIIYSDGLVEARDSSDTEFGLDRLLRLAPLLRNYSPSEAGRHLLAEIDRFLGPNRPHDDLSIILLKRLAG